MQEIKNRILQLKKAEDFIYISGILVVCQGTFYSVGGQVNLTLEEAVVAVKAWIDC